MPSAWGTSWGASWGSSWGAVAVEPANQQPQVWAGGDYREYRDYLATGHASIVMSWQALASASVIENAPDDVVLQERITHGSAASAYVNLHITHGVATASGVAYAIWDSSADARCTMSCRTVAQSATASVIWDSSAACDTGVIVATTADGDGSFDDRDQEDVLIAVAAYMLKRRRLARK